MVLAQKQTYGSTEHNRESRNKPTHLWSISFDKGGKNIQWRKDSLFSKWCWESWTAACKSMKHSLTLYTHTHTHTHTHTNSKGLKDLKIRHDVIKLLEENIGKTLSDINYSNVFLGQSPKAIEIKAKINKWDLSNIQAFAHQRKT